MKYKILSAGVLVGAYVLVNQIKNKEESDKGKGRLRDKLSKPRRYKVELENEEGGRFQVTVRAANRNKAHEKIKTDFAKGYRMLGMERID
jgi:hypothetical protein